MKLLPLRPHEYVVPINSPEQNEDGTLGSVTCDVVKLTGRTKKRRIKQWRQYLTIRLGTCDVHTFNKVTKALGFTRLLP